MRTFFTTLLTCLSVLAPAAMAQPVDLLLVAADDELLQPIVRQLEAPHVELHGAWTIWTGRFRGRSLALTRSEGDPLNAVAATTLAIRLHPPRLIFVYGVSRAHDPVLTAGQVVLSEKFVAFEGMVSPQLKLDAGSNPLAWNQLPHLLMSPGEKETAAEYFPADPGALAIAQRMSTARSSVICGVLGSAPQINRELDRIAWIREHWNTSTEDGESAHIAGCARIFNVPIFGARIIGGPSSEIVAYAEAFVEAWK